MDKIKTVKIKNEDGSISEESYTISVDAKNVDMDNGDDLQYTIGNINVDDDGNIGEQLKNLNENVDNLNIDIEKKPYYYNSIADMKADVKLQNGDMAITLGYYSVNDGGGAEYNIVNDTYAIDNGGTHIELDNGLFAELIIKNNTINIKQFGCKSGDATFDNTPRLRLITTFLSNTGGIIWIPKEIFYVNITDSYAVRLYSNMEVCGGGTLKLFPECTKGNTFILGTPNGQDTFTNIYIHDIVVDGSYQKGVTVNRNLNNVCLWNASNSVIENVTSINAVFCGLMIRSETVGQYCFNNKIINNNVLDARYIGIQTTHDSNVVIANNTVYNTGDNCIDVYGDDPNSQLSVDYNVVVDSNTLYGGKVGIFIESIPQLICTSNNIKRCERGVAINRIHSGSNFSICANNLIDGDYDPEDLESLIGLDGFWIVNQNYGINIHDNTIRHVKRGIYIDRLAYGIIDHNIFSNIDDPYLINIKQDASFGIQRSQITNNILMVNVGPGGEPYKFLTTSSDPYASLNPDRVDGATLIENNRRLRNNGILPTEYWVSINPVGTYGSWSGACSIYYQGYTRVCIGDASEINANTGYSLSWRTAGTYLYHKEQDTWYLVRSCTGRETEITDLQGNAGDWHTTFTEGDHIYIYTAEAYALAHV